MNKIDPNLSITVNILKKEKSLLDWPRQFTRNY